MKLVIINESEAGQRLDKYLNKLLKEAGKSFLYKMLRKKNITLNGKKAEGKEMLSVGDQVCFFFSDETYDKFRGDAGKIEKSEQKSKMPTGRSSGNSLCINLRTPISCTITASTPFSYTVLI